MQISRASQSRGWQPCFQERGGASWSVSKMAVDMYGLGYERRGLCQS